MSESSGQPVDIWKRLKKLTKERKKVVDRLRRVNESISTRSAKLNQVGEKYGQITFALEKMRDELSDEQVATMVKLLSVLTEKVDKLILEIKALIST